MDTIKVDHGKVQMIAHRGVSGLELENTCAAFVAAGSRSYWGIETDIHQTADGKYVIFHDDRTGRVATIDIPVEQSTYDELRSLQLKEVRNNDAVRVDLKMPNPEEYFAICKRYGKVAVLELKNPFKQEAVREIVAIAKREIGIENVVFISFYFQNLVYIREAAPDAKCEYLIGKALSEPARVKLLMHKIDLDINHNYLTKELVEDLHANGILVNCWTVDNAQRAAELISWGVDQITTNILE